MIIFDEKIVGVWFLSVAPGVDWLAAVREVEPELKYELTYRFRYHKDDKSFDSKDEKHWYEGTVSGTRNYVTMTIRSLAKEMRDRSGHYDRYSYELLNDGDLDAFMRKWQDAPFVFGRMESPSGEDTPCRP
jgi:hypothetical protein